VTQKPSWRLLAALAVLVVVVAAAGYSFVGRSAPGAGDASDSGVEADGGAVAGDGAAQPHATSAEQISAMIDKLAARLKENPTDAVGWGMLARSYSVLGRNDEAVDAYAKAAELNKNDAGLLVDYADALAVKNNRTLAGEPMKLIDRALKLDPRNIKALAMAGTYAYDRKDYRTAVKFWEQVGEFGGADNPFSQQIQPGLVEARQLAGLPAIEQPASSSLAALAQGGVPASTASAPAPNGSIRGTVTLAPALAKAAKAEDTVFIFARAAEGSRMPLAILRKQVKDLPISFTLDDSMAMSPTASLSKAGRVTVGARISKSGNAIPEKGDLSGQSALVAVGTKDLAIEIKEVVKQ
jgi:cytochrome c-type biogenesis protein CcmH